MLLSSVLYHLFDIPIQTRYPRYTTCSVLFDAHVMIMFLLHPVVCFMLHVSVTPYLYRALCFVVENVFHALHHLRTCMSCLSSVFLRMYRCCFSCHMSFYLLCYIHVMLHVLHRCVFIPKMTPISTHWPFLTLFGVLKKPCCHLDTPKNTPFLASRVAQLCDTGPQNTPKIGPK